MEVRILGSLEVVDDLGRLVAVRGARLTRLLIGLTLRCGEVVTDDRLSDILWGEAPPDGAGALRRQISTLRRVLGRADVVIRRGAGYVLAIDRDAIDAFRFESLASRGQAALRDGEVREAAHCLRAALDLWRGDALVDVVDDSSCEADRVRLTELRIAAIEARVDADLALGRHADLVAELEHLVAAHPMREHLRAQLMLALSRSGRQTEALRSYAAARSVLAEEVGLEPSPELRALQTAILRHDDTTVGRDPEPTSTPRRSQIRTPLSSLVGRGDLLDELAARVRRRRLVTLVGPGGVGKTRLAIEAAREVLEAGVLEVWLVELADVTNGDGVASAIAAVLGLAISVDPRGDLTRVVEFACGRNTLVVVDNCEHLVEAVARVAQDLLELCPTMRILATSRERLGVPGEVVCPLPPLSIPDAVSLFVERASAAAPAAALTDEGDVEWPLLESICGRLDGLPLAIELAASRLSSMPLAELSVGLDDRFRLLNRGARTARPRQQTLRAVVDWSYDLLFDDERRVLDRLSVFTGGCDLAAARAVCADDTISADDVAELVTRLADKSLITIEDTGGGHVRGRMLETLVAYGRERLAETGDLRRVRAAHARYFRQLAADSMAALRGVDQNRWLRAITSNMGNLRVVFEAAMTSGDTETAQQIAGSLGWYWWFTGRALEGSGWLTAALNRPGGSGQVTRARVLAWGTFTEAPGFILWGDVDEVGEAAIRDVGDDEDELYATAIPSYREASMDDELVGIETALAVTCSTRGDQTKARELLSDAERILAGLDSEPWVRAMRAFVCGRRAFVEDRYDDAEAAMRASLPLLGAIGGHVYSSFAHRYIARLAAVRDDHGAAVDAIEAALRLARDLRLSAFVNALLIDLAASHAALGNFQLARRDLTELLRSAHDQRAPTGVREATTALAWVEWQAGNPPEAERLAVEAFGGAADHGDKAVHCSVILGLAAEQRGDTTEARHRHRHALDIACHTHDPRLLGLALEGLAAVAVQDRRAEEAARLLGAAASLRKSFGRATGWGFASITPVDVDRLKVRTIDIIGAQPAADGYSTGLDNPQSVIDQASSPKRCTRRAADAESTSEGRPPSSGRGRSVSRTRAPLHPCAPKDDGVDVDLICEVFDLGTPIGRPTYVARGELGRVSRLTTTAGTWAAKEIDLFVPTVEEADANVGLQQLMLEAGVNLPHPRRTVDGHGLFGNVRVYEWLDLVPILAGDRDAEALVAVSLARIHLAAPFADGTPDPWYCETLARDGWDRLLVEGSGTWWAPHVAALIDQLADLPRPVHAPVRVCHLDVCPENVFFCDGRLTVIDWENAGPAATIQDLGSTLWDFCQGDIVRTHGFVEHYGRNGGPIERLQGSVFDTARVVQANLLAFHCRRALDPTGAPDTHQRAEQALHALLARPLTTRLIGEMIAAPP